MAYEYFEKNVKPALSKVDGKNLPEFAVQVNVSGNGAGAFYVANKGGFSVEPFDYKDNDGQVWIDGDDLIAVIAGKADIKALCEAGKIKCEGEPCALGKVFESLKKPAPKKAEPKAESKPEVKAEPKVEPKKAEPAKAEVKPEPKKAEPAKAEPAKTEAKKAEPAKVEAKKAEPVKVEARTGNKQNNNKKTDTKKK